MEPPGAGPVPRGPISVRIPHVPRDLPGKPPRRLEACVRNLARLRPSALWMTSHAIMVRCPGGDAVGRDVRLSRGRPAPFSTAVAADGGRVRLRSWHGAVPVMTGPASRVSPGAGTTSPPARSARDTVFSPADSARVRPVPRVLAACPTASAIGAFCLRRLPGSSRVGVRAIAPHSGLGAIARRNPPDPAARGPGLAHGRVPLGPPKPTQGRPFRAGPPRRGSGRRRMGQYQPRRRHFEAPATPLRRGRALSRRGAEIPLP